MPNCDHDFGDDDVCKKCSGKKCKECNGQGRSSCSRCGGAGAGLAYGMSVMSGCDFCTDGSVSCVRCRETGAR